MKISRKSLILCIASIAIIAISFTVMLLDALIPLNFWVHPALTLLFCLCIGFGIMTVTLGIINKSPVYYFLSAVLLGLALLYALINLVKFWWIGLIALVLLWVVMAIFSFMSAGNQTENIALNKSPDYKDYNQRKAEKEAKEAEEEKEEKELPKIKSFKD